MEIYNPVILKAIGNFFKNYIIFWERILKKEEKPQIRLPMLSKIKSQ